VRLGFIAKHRAVWPVRVLCSVLEISASRFYEWLGRRPSKRAVSNDKLTGLIRQSFEARDRTYGSRRVWRDVLSWGERCGIHRVARLMRAEGLAARKKRRRSPYDTGVRPENSIAPKLLQREFEADGPNKKWLADFTYVWAGEGWLYVAVVLDVYSRRIVGWSMKSEMTAQLVIDALVMAVWRRGKPKELLHHSDQGSQYTSDDFQRLLSAHGITCSMSRKGNCWDNAAMESFFSSLKTERVDRRPYASRDDARADVFDYIERFYNPRRRHSVLDYLSPIQFEEKAAAL
jgi:putative transposase